MFKVAYEDPTAAPNPFKTNTTAAADGERVIRRPPTVVPVVCVDRRGRRQTISIAGREFETSVVRV